MLEVLQKVFPSDAALYLNSVTAVQSQAVRLGAPPLLVCNTGRACWKVCK